MSVLLYVTISLNFSNQSAHGGFDKYIGLSSFNILSIVNLDQLQLYILHNRTIHPGIPA